jgi:hypothetical protein
VSSRIARLLSAATALGCAALGAILACHYPIAPALAITLFALWVACCSRWPSVWIIAIPTLLPITGFAMWTGWFAFEELDLMILGAAAGGYAAMALRAQIAQEKDRREPHFSPLIRIMLVGFAVSWAVALYRGVTDAGGFEFDWIGTYHSPMNSLRLAKSYAMALLLWPLLQSAFRANEQRTLELLAGGLTLGLGAASIAALSERLAFTALLNFSSDYRTTALFWEMHVGGAALDGFLALTFPFIVWELRRRPGPLRLGIAVLLAATATYACLTTFSRGVYLAVPGGIATLTLLLLARRPVIPWAFYWRMTAVAAIAACATYLVFRHGGYRSLAAFLATLAAGLALGGSVQGARFRDWSSAMVVGLITGAVLVAGALQIHKAPYVVFTLAFAWNAVLSLPSSISSRRGVFTRLFAFGILVAAAGGIPLYWGGQIAFVDSLVALVFAAAFATANALSARPWIPTDIRSRSISLGVVCLLAGAVAVFGGGAYMGERLADASNDLELRILHWKDGVGMLHTVDDWWLGKGFGRFPANYFFHAVAGRALPGSFSLHRGDGVRYLALGGPRYPTSWGDLFRIAQRVTLSPGIYTAVLEVRSPLATELHIEICEQQLLYNGECGAANRWVPARPDWQQISVVLDGSRLSSGSWYARRFGFFALAVESSGLALDIRDVALISPDGRNLIANRDFSEGMERWIPISERYHLPWHIKNLELNVLFDQGIVGLTIFALLLLAALWRVAFGDARGHPVAPFLAASMAGFIIVGAFDSLLDVPRLAFLFYLLLLTSLGLQASRTSPIPRQ